MTGAFLQIFWEGGRVEQVNIEYSEHLEFRLKLRGIQHDLPERVLVEADEYFYDTETQLFIAAKDIIVGGKARTFIVAFTRSVNSVKLVTIHPLKYNQKINRINSKRWLRIKMTI